MTKEALKLALDALEEAADAIDSWGSYASEYFQVKHDLENDISKAKSAITAIKAALEAKDEPVAWRDAAIRLGEELSSVGPNGYYNMSAKEWLDWAMEQNPRGEHSLPQRTWVGLTDDEIEVIEVLRAPPVHPDFVDCDDWVEFARAIEAKLRSKNHDS